MSKLKSIKGAIFDTEKGDVIITLHKGSGTYNVDISQTEEPSNIVSNINPLKIDFTKE